MVRNLGTWIGIVLISGSIGCLLYTNPVNEAPMVRSITVPSNPVRNVPFTLMADVKDDDQGSLQYDWRVFDGVCPDGHVMPSTPPAAPPSQDIKYNVTLKDLGDFCVFLTVTDEHGATGHDSASFRIVDRPPMVLLTQVAPPPVAGTKVPLYSSMRFSIKGSSDPDGEVPTYTWALTMPSESSSMTSSMTPPPCEDAPADVCFDVLVSGQYELVVTADDGQGMTAPGVLSFEVADDQPPCIVSVSPDAQVMGRPRDPTMPLTFTVNGVTDDGDPYPAMGRPSMLSFKWSVREGDVGNFRQFVPLDRPDFTIPAGTYPSGEKVEVRVEADDRRRDQVETQNCYETSPDKPLCPWPQTNCSQWVTWTVTFQ